VVAAGGLAGYAVALAEGSITAVDTTRAYLARIAAYDGKLLCYEHVATDAAMAQAAEADSSVAPAAGACCTGLRGVPVGVKDIIAIRGMPVTCGSALEDLGILQISSLVGPEGSFIRSLRTAGAIFLGKTKTVEFASGGLGINTVRGTPWNPADLTVHRTPGGSSSGSAAGVAAGLCALSIGTDTGGSVRIPAALCGIFGLKTSVGRWSTDGVFPYSSTFDSIGLLTRSAADAAVAYSAIEAANGNEEASSPLLPTSLQVKLGVPSSFFYEDLEPRVAAAIDGVLTRLEEEGAELVPIDLSEELSDVVALRVRRLDLQHSDGSTIMIVLFFSFAIASLLDAGSDSSSRIHTVVWR
jgi:aspartyl-tRNA(Asn)/glutamyl-tRNA(Gln) amidotransferase subunit A